MTPLQNNGKIPWHQRLYTIIMVSFIGLFLVPMGLIIATSYQAIHDAAFDDAQRALKSVALERKNQIDTYFQRVLVDLEIQSKNRPNAIFMKALTRAFKKSNLSAPQFVKSQTWGKITMDHSANINLFMQGNQYYDVFLIDPQGNILYTVTQENDLGTNLFKGQHLHTNSQFSRTVRQVLDTGRPSVSDFDEYPYSRHGIYGFMAAPILYSGGKIRGVLAVQYPITQINRISLSDVALGESTEVFLIGPDRSLRSASKGDPNRVILETRINTPPALAWNSTQSGTIGLAPHTAHLYTGPKGKPLLGMYENIQVLDLAFGIIAQISQEEAFASLEKFKMLNSLLFGVTTAAVALFALFLSRKIVKPLTALANGARAVTMGDYTQTTDIRAHNEIGQLSRVFNSMLKTLDKDRQENQHRDWIKTGQAQLSENLQGHRDMESLCNGIISTLCNYLNAQVGALYMAHEDGSLTCSGGHALAKGHATRIDPGQGLTGQAAIERQGKILTQYPPDYLPITSGVGQTAPVNVLIHPLLDEDQVVGMVEMGSMEAFGDREREFVNAITHIITAALQSMTSRTQEQRLLEKVKNQHEELKATNEELEEQATTLKNNQEELQTQSEELQTANEELTEKTKQLFSQQAQLEESREQLAKEAQKLSLANQYKSEFLANMSHELRSPLNSLLILAQTLAENPDQNLTPDQIKSARIIYKGGNELLALINDILDLSKIEAGRMEVFLEPLPLASLFSDLEERFTPLAKEKGLSLEFTHTPNLPDHLVADGRMLNQILNNFLTNAIKFTHKGSITLTAAPESNGKHLVIGVTDTGIGVPAEKQECIFDAFIQADGTTTRKYGGTGLGLSISKQLATLLGGSVAMESQEGQGSTFSLRLPLDLTPTRTKPSLKKPELPPGMAGETILIIEDDLTFAHVVQELAQQKGYQAQICPTGKQGLKLAQKLNPKGIVLDLALPDMDGKKILEALKAEPATQHIPIHIISGRDDILPCMEKGATGFLLKPAGKNEILSALDRIVQTPDKGTKEVLLVEDEKVHREKITQLIGKKDISITIADTGKEAMEAIRSQPFHCVILDLSLPDMDGLDILDQLAEESLDHGLPPVLVYTAKDLSRREMNRLLQYAQQVIPKGPEGFQRLRDEFSLFLTTMESKNKLPEKATPGEHGVFKDKNVLLVDDDMRNIFAMSGLLQRAGMTVTMAENGMDALEKMETVEFDIVLMDIMMPEMDGYQATREIRKQIRFKSLPIIALTAKAMPEDREKCMEVGVNDYLAKPIDKEKLFSILKVWLYSV